MLICVAINIGKIEPNYTPIPFALLCGRALGFRERERERVKQLMYVGAIKIVFSTRKIYRALTSCWLLPMNIWIFNFSSSLTGVVSFLPDLAPFQRDFVGYRLSSMGNCYGRPAIAHASSTHFSAHSDGTKPSIKSSKDSTSSSQHNPFGSLNKILVPSKSDISASSSVKNFSFNDLKIASKNFRSESLLGEGGFGCVFKGWLDENTLAPTKPGMGMVVAIKKLKMESFQGHKEWLAEVNYLGQLRHENLVKLFGYCSESDNRLLVYEFMPKGSLENHLFKKGVQPISWATRMSIAIDVAQGISFLHSLDPSVIYRDLKASNILLDSDFKAKLSDFGLARDGPTGDNTHVSTRVVGTQGYAAPEYVATGHLTPKSDVYSFGVVLLELLSGRRAMDDEKAGGVEETLAEWAKPFLSDNRRVLRIMDTRLGGQYSKKGAQAAASLALQCLHTDPKNRPPMPDVLAKLEQLPKTRDIPRTASPRAEYHSTNHSSNAGHTHKARAGGAANLV